MTHPESETGIDNNISKVNPLSLQRSKEHLTAELDRLFTHAPDLAQEVVAKFHEKEKIAFQKQLESLRPAGWEFAPESAKNRIEKLQEEGDIKLLERIRDVISYNPDGTMNFLRLKKTFCNDLSREEKKMNRAEAFGLATHSGNKLLTTYNEYDGGSDGDLHFADMFIIIYELSPSTTFNSYFDDRVESTIGLFMDMAGCKSNARYRTNSRFKDKTGKKVDNSFLALMPTPNGFRIGAADENNKYYVCGRKDMETTM